ncbi:ribosomal protein L17 [Papiliotrema laurentii]|uniref:Ribosomal protein L17 n=1 Tax=Papiliotrema laurentii TaxID=5418 RepID=A0AAD9FT16_PAPLA|nr:ribosomal protein L17 [Papiliotrema laurentii]
MRHGKKLAKLPGRDPAAKLLHLKNLVSALLHHEMIVTTLARAKYTAKKAEKMISKGKRGTGTQALKAQSFFLKPHHHSLESHSYDPVPPPRAPIGYPEIPADAEPGTYERPVSLMSKVFLTLAERYKDRQGGYTRILRYGRRQGDKAKMAVVCLVDGPKDLRPELLARQIGKQAVVGSELQEGQLLSGGVEEWKKHLTKAQLGSLNKYLKFRSEQGKAEFEEKVKKYADYVVAEGETQHLQRPSDKMIALSYAEQRREPEPWKGYAPKAGERLSGTSTKHSALSLARGMLRGPGNVMGRFKREPLQPIQNQFLKRAGPVKMASAQDL